MQASSKGYGHTRVSLSAQNNDETSTQLVSLTSCYKTAHIATVHAAGLCQAQQLERLGFADMLPVDTLPCPAITCRQAARLLQFSHLCTLAPQCRLVPQNVRQL